MIVVNDHDYDALEAADATMARILCGSYIALMAIINLNILIALLSDTFTRVYGNAVANAVMQRAKTILFLEKSLTWKRKRQYEDFIKNYGSPETVDLQRDISANSDRDEQKAADMLRDSVQEIHHLIHERFGKQYGEGKKSDLDHIKESLQVIHQGGSVQQKCECKGIKRKMDMMQEVLTKLCNSMKVDISGLQTQPYSSSDDDTLVPESEARSKEKDEEEWNYENNNEITLYDIQRSSPNQQFRPISKAAINEGFQFEDEEPEMSRNARKRGSPRGRGSVNLGSRSSKDNEDISYEPPFDPRIMSYRKAISKRRMERRQGRPSPNKKAFRDESETSSPEVRRRAKGSRDVPSAPSRERSPVRPRAEVRRAESMPSRIPDDIPRMRRRHSLKKGSRHSPRRKMEERRADEEETIPRRHRRSPDR